VLLRRLLPAAALMIACATAAASGRAGAETLVMVSPPAELDAAVRTSLAPWRVKIIVVDLASGTPAELALAQGAGFVVWRDADELVLWDAQAGVGERRDIPADLDDANAAALALSIKTWMHLGAPPPPGGGDTIGDEPADDGSGGTGATGATGDVHGTVPLPVPVPVPVPPAAPLAPPRLRVEAAAGTRANMTDEGRAVFRAAVAAITRTGPLDVSLQLELGPSQATADAVAEGDLSTIDVSVHARYGVSMTPSITLTPSAGLVLVRSAFSGVDSMQRTFAASDTAPALDASGLLEWRRSRFVVSGEVGVTYVLISQELQDRNMRLVTPAHIEPRGLVRVGLVLR
jgi:hypothetical protein